MCYTGSMISQTLCHANSPPMSLQLSTPCRQPTCSTGSLAPSGEHQYMHPAQHLLILLPQPPEQGQEPEAGAERGSPETPVIASQEQWAEWWPEAHRAHAAHHLDISGLTKIDVYACMNKSSIQPMLCIWFQWPQLKDTLSLNSYLAKYADKEIQISLYKITIPAGRLIAIALPLLPFILFWFGLIRKYFHVICQNVTCMVLKDQNGETSCIQEMVIYHKFNIYISDFFPSAFIFVASVRPLLAFCPQPKGIVRSLSFFL